MKRIFSIFLVAIMLFSTLAIGTQAQEVTTENTQEKLTDELKAHLETVENDEYVPIYIWLNEQDEEMVYAVLSKTLGMTVTKNSEEAYIERKASAKAELLSKGLENLAKTPEYSLQARATGKVDIANLTAETFKTQANIPEIMTNEEIKNCLESGMTSDEIIELSERTQFLSEYRHARKSLNNATNEQFYKLLDLDKCKNVYLDPLLAYVQVETTKSYICNIESISNVKQIGLYQKTKFSTERKENNYESTTNRGIIDGVGYYMTDSYSYTGAGVKVGIIEAVEETKIKDDNGTETILQGSYIDLTAPHLLGKTITTNVPTTNRVSLHATRVASILCGKPVAFNGVTYQGIAPQVSLYYTNLCVYSSNELQNALSWMFENEVSVINISFGNYSEYKYKLEDQIVDNFITNYRTTIVVASGNVIINEKTQEVTNPNKYVTSPGLAYNAITVGNLNEYSADNGQHFICGTSCYKESLYLTNKPDVCMFGSFVGMVETYFNEDDNTTETGVYLLDPGTSFSTPMVTATVALMINADPNLSGKVDTIKAIIMASADEEGVFFYSNETVNMNPIRNDFNYQISDSSKIASAAPGSTINDNNATCSILREESGAGLLNIPAAIRLAESGFYFDLVGGEYTSDTIYISANTTIEFGVVFEKYTNEPLDDGAYSRQMDIQILDSTGTVIFESTDTVNNVKMFKCTILQGGDYRFRIITPDYSEAISSAMNATMIITCACKDKNITIQSPCNPGAHFVTCSCGFEIAEVHKFNDALVIPLSNGATFVVEIAYLYERGNSTSGIFECYDEHYYFVPASGTNMTFQGLAPHENTSVQIIPTGKIVKFSYNVVIENNGQYSYVQTREVTFVYDYFAKTIEIS